MAEESGVGTPRHHMLQPPFAASSMDNREKVKQELGVLRGKVEY